MTAKSDGMGQRSHRGRRHGQQSSGRPPIYAATTRGALPRRLVAEDRRWVDGLTNGAENHERTCRDLHALLLRTAKFEVAQRRNAHQVGGADLDDLACQAASDALLRIIRKAGEFRGDSRFTTWAKRFVGFEVRSKLRQYATRHLTVGIGPEHDAVLVEANSDPYVHAEAQDLADAIRSVVNDQFSANQRSVFLGLLTHDVTPADLGLQMGLTANAIHQTAFRARHCLRGQLRANGFLD